MKRKIKREREIRQRYMVDSLSVLSRVMDFQSAMETFAEAWVAANVTQVSFFKFLTLKKLCVKIEQFSRTYERCFCV